MQALSQKTSRLGLILLALLTLSTVALFTAASVQIWYATRPNQIASLELDAAVWSLVGTLFAALLLLALSLGLAMAIAGQLWRMQRLVTHAQRLAADQHKRWEAVLEASSDGILLADVQDIVERANPAAQVMFGNPKDQLIGRALRELVPGMPGPEPGQPHAAAAAGNGLPTCYDTEIPSTRDRSFRAHVWSRQLQLQNGTFRLLVIQDLSASIHQTQRLEFLEQRDVLTGLLNRKEFERRMQRMLADSAGSQTNYVLCYIDIDQFKVINDTVGHTAGDALIEQLAALFEVKLDDAVLLARLGGDEFGALFMNYSEARARARCDEMLRSIRAFRFTWNERSFEIAASIGVTAFMPDNDSAVAELAKADVACYVAKLAGRNRVHVYRDGDESAADHHCEMQLVTTISDALNRGRFQLHAQPIVPLGKNGAGLAHYEILVRMLDENMQLVMPGRFIAAAERYNLMPAVDRWVIRELFSTRGAQLRTWYASHPEQFLFAINLSGNSLSDEDFPAFLKHQFEINRVPPASICFEITETSAIGNLRGARGLMRDLAAMGCRFALDDFGSGLSSYSYLRELPVNYLKIDGSFVQDIGHNSVNHALVDSMNHIAHVLGLKTIAEWAEDDATIKQLESMRLDYAQGYATGRPMLITDCDFSAGKIPG